MDPLTQRTIDRIFKALFDLERKIAAIKPVTTVVTQAAASTPTSSTPPAGGGTETIIDNTGDYDGGAPDSNYGGITAVDGGTP